MMSNTSTLFSHKNWNQLKKSSKLWWYCLICYIFFQYVIQCHIYPIFIFWTYYIRILDVFWRCNNDSHDLNTFLHYFSFTEQWPWHSLRYWYIILKLTVSTFRICMSSKEYLEHFWWKWRQIIVPYFLYFEKIKAIKISSKFRYFSSNWPAACQYVIEYHIYP